MLWDHIYESIWTARNEIRHSKSNNVSQVKLQQLSDKCLWYLRHENEVLDIRHHLLVNYTAMIIRHWSRTTRQAKLNLLNNAYTFYKNACTQWEQHQTCITYWIDDYTSLWSGRPIGRGIKCLRYHRKIYYTIVIAPKNINSISNGNLKSQALKQLNYLCNAHSVHQKS